jgi:hypothetical protein
MNVWESPDCGQRVRDLRCPGTSVQRHRGLRSRPHRPRHRQRVGVPSAGRPRAVRVGGGGRNPRSRNASGRPAREGLAGRLSTKSRHRGAGGLFGLGSFHNRDAESRGEVGRAHCGRADGTLSEILAAARRGRGGRFAPPTGKAPSENRKGTRRLSPVAWHHLPIPWPSPAAQPRPPRPTAHGRGRTAPASNPVFSQGFQGASVWLDCSLARERAL